MRPIIIVKIFFGDSNSTCFTSSYCIFILENGEVAYLSYYDLASTGNTTIKKIDGLKNIVTVVSSRTMPYLVDKDGNEYSLSDYIK